MKKIIIKSVTLLLTLCLVIGITACGNSKPEIYTNGGTLPPAENGAEYTEFAELVATKPTKEGFEFAGWYSDSKFTDYIDPNAISSKQAKKGKAYAKFIETPDEVHYSVRSHEATITDSGRKNQKLDCIPTSEDFNFIDLQRAGYSSVKVTVRLEGKEVDNGYQYIFLYSNKSCASGGDSFDSLVNKYIFGKDPKDPSLLYVEKRELTPGNLQEYYSSLSFTVTIPLDQLQEDIYIRYGASGKYNDDWVNRSVSATVAPVK